MSDTGNAGKAAAARLTAAGLALLLAAACGGPEESPQARIKALVARAEQAAEDHDLSVFKDHIADDYHDNHGYDRRTVLRLVQGMLLRNQQIHLLSVVRDVRVQDTAGYARVLVAMASQPIESSDALLNMRADLMRFDLQLFRDGDEWQVRSVDWKRAKAEDFL